MFWFWFSAQKIYYIESIDANNLRLKSWKGDYLHRADTNVARDKVTAWDTGIGNDWTIECISLLPNPKIRLKSLKGDYLHRADTNEAQDKVTVWDTGVGNEWIIELI